MIKFECSGEKSDEILKCIPGSSAAEEKLPLLSVLSSTISKEQMVPHTYIHRNVFIHAVSSLTI